MGISIAYYRGNSSEQVNSDENSHHTSPRDKPYNTDYPRKDIRFEIEGPSRKQLKKSPCFRTVENSVVSVKSSVTSTQRKTPTDCKSESEYFHLVKAATGTF